MMPSQLDALTDINLADLAASFGLRNGSPSARLLQKIFFKYAQTFARQMTEFDRATGEGGLAVGARAALKHHFDDIRVHGADRIPASAFLALSNHPGLSDTLAAFAALDRPDLKVIALQRPFLEALTYVSKQIFFVTDEQSVRTTLVRQVSAHLRSGGAVLTYPAGRIEPDPDVHSDAVESLSTWMDSVGVFIRLAPDTPILPLVVRGVVWRRALYHPITRIRRTRLDREALAAAIQVFAHMRGKIKELKVCVQIGEPIYTKDLGSSETRVIHQAVLSEMKHLIENRPKDGDESAL